jgi:hypothetical protein
LISCKHKIKEKEEEDRKDKVNILVQMTYLYSCTLKEVKKDVLMFIHE